MKQPVWALAASVLLAAGAVGCTANEEHTRAPEPATPPRVAQTNPASEAPSASPAPPIKPDERLQEWVDQEAVPYVRPEAETAAKPDNPAGTGEQSKAAPGAPVAKAPAPEYGEPGAQTLQEAIEILGNKQGQPKTVDEERLANLVAQDVEGFFSAAINADSPETPPKPASRRPAVGRPHSGNGRPYVIEQTEGYLASGIMGAPAPTAPGTVAQPTPGNSPSLGIDMSGAWFKAGQGDRSLFSGLALQWTSNTTSAVFSPPGTESYDRIAENRFASPWNAPLSTFSIDVDTASYANLRRFIDQGRRPPVDAVRIEEMINYFGYDYPEPEGEHPFSVTTEVTTAPWNSEHQLVRIGLHGKSVDTADLPPANLVFLVDVSGSMQNTNKLPLVKKSLRLLVDRLREQDRVALVTYASGTRVALPPTPGSDRLAILEAIDRLSAGGSTNGEGGLKLAYQTAREHFMEEGNNRILLATDGDFNVGQSSDSAMVKLIESERDGGISLTVLGFGMGNYKDSKMEKLADHGNGNAAYIDGLTEARKVLVEEMGGTLLTIAKDVKLQVEFNPERVEAYRLIGYENRKMAARDFNDDSKDAGELGAGHTVTALYEVVPAGTPVNMPGVDALKYQRPKPRTEAVASDELLTVKLRYKQPGGDTSRLLEVALKGNPLPLAETSRDLRFAASVAEFGLLMRQSAYRGNASWDGLLERAAASLGEDRHGHRHQFVLLARKARGIVQAVN